MSLLGMLIEAHPIELPSYLLSKEGRKYLLSTPQGVNKEVKSLVN